MKGGKGFFEDLACTDNDKMEEEWGRLFLSRQTVFVCITMSTYFFSSAPGAGFYLGNLFFSPNIGSFIAK